MRNVGIIVLMIFVVLASFFTLDFTDTVDFGLDEIVFGAGVDQGCVVVSHTSSSVTCRNSDGSFTKTLYSAPIFDEDSDYLDFAEVTSVDWMNGGWNFSYKDYCVHIVPSVITQNNNELSLQQVKTNFPNIEFEPYRTKKVGGWKYGLKIINITTQQANGLKYFKLYIDSACNLQWSDLETDGYGAIIKNKIKLGFGDLIESGYTLNRTDKRTLLIGGDWATHMNNSIIDIDPTISLDETNGGNIGDTYVGGIVIGPNNNYGAIEYMAFVNTTINDVFYARQGFMRWNLSSIPEDAIIESAELYLYVDLNGLDNGESYEIEALHIYQDYTIDGVQWKEGNKSGSAAGDGEMNWNERPTTGYFNPVGEDSFTMGYNDPLDDWVWLNITQMTQSELDDGNNNVSIWLHAYNPQGGSITNGDYAWIRSKEYTTDTSLRPFLNITYSVPEEEGEKYYFNTSLNDSYIIADVTEDQTVLNNGEVGLMIKWNLTDLCAYGENLTINSSKLQFRITGKTGSTGSPDNNVQVGIITNQSWDESTISCPGFPSICGAPMQDTGINESTTTLSSTTVNTYTNITVTNLVAEACYRGDNYLTIEVIDPDHDPKASTESIYSTHDTTTISIGDFQLSTPMHYDFGSREHATQAYRPKLWLAYEVPSQGLTVTLNTSASDENSVLMWWDTFDAEWYTNAGGNLDSCQIELNGTNITATKIGYKCTYTNSSLNYGNSTFIGWATYGGISNHTSEYWVQHNIIPEITATMNTSISDENEDFVLGQTAYFEWYINDTSFTINNCLFEIDNTNFSANVAGYKCNYTVNMSSLGIGNYNLRAWINTTSQKSDWTNTYTLDVLNSMAWDEYRTRINDYSYNGSVEAWWYTNSPITINNCGLEFDGTNYTGSIVGKNCTVNITGLSEGNYTAYGWINSSAGNIQNTTSAWFQVYEDLDPSGYWVMRAPVDDIITGDSYPCIYAGTGDPVYNCGNGQDTGVFWRNGSGIEQGFEERHCDNWAQVFNDAPDINKGMIDKVYCHIWTDQDDYTALSGYGAYYDPSNFLTGTRIYDEDYDSQPGNATYYQLVIYNQSGLGYNFSDPKDFLNFSLKVGGTNVQVLSSRQQQTFCIYNRLGYGEIDNETEMSQQDSDGDGLDDWTELWETFTNPFIADTDNDGYNDGFEYSNDKNGYDPYDWGIVHKYYANLSNWTITYKTLNDQSSASFESVISTLANEVTSDQYNNLSTYNGGYPDINLSVYTTGGVAKKALAQINFHVQVNESPSAINFLNVFYGGRNRIYSATNGAYNFSNIIYNSSGGTIYLPGRYQPTYSRYTYQLSDQSAISDVVAQR